MKDSKIFPLWFTILSNMFFISNLFIFGLMTLFRPSLAFPDAGDAAVFPIQFFAVRHIAMALPLLYGLVRKDVKILTLMYSIFFVMSTLDIILLGIFDYSIPVMGLIPSIGRLSAIGSVFLGIGIFLVPITFALIYLNSDQQK